MSLATKYRPKTFDDVSEQPMVVNILSKMCSSGLSTRNFLFIGSAGVGKTTIARLVSKSINDNICEPIEIDAASNNGVEDAREITQQAKYNPVVGKYKVFLIDECHCISPQAWSVWLKTLEEGPAKSVFLFCTTNPEKIPDTILSRVVTFQLSKISLQGIHNRLIHVLESEINEGRDIIYTEDAVNFIAKLANGGMRDALTMLDKVLAYSGDLSTDTVAKALNLPNYDDYFKLLQSIVKQDNKGVTELIHFVYNSGVNFNKWFESFHAFVINIVKYTLLQDIDKTMIPSTYLSKISKYTSAHASICLKIANVLVKLNHELKFTNYHQELALTYLCSSSKKG